jgi:mono/diheme cytochrome c family protein
LGDFGPRLVGSTVIINPKSLATRILFGGGAMPGFSDQLSDAQVAAIVNFVRTSLNTQTDTIGADVVAAARGQ